MSSRTPELLTRRYVAWLRKRAYAVIAAYALLFAGALYLIAFKLPLFADFSYLLPQDAPAVKDLRKLEARVRASDTMLVIVQGMTPELREQAVTEMMNGIIAAKSPLVERVTGDEKETREFYQARRHMMVELSDLEKARDGLQKQVDKAKLKANPLFIDLGDEDEDKEAAAADKKQLDELREKKRNAEERLYHPTNVSKDGLVGKIEVATAFPSTDAKRGELLLHTLQGVRTRVMAAHPGVIIGFTGGAVTALSEHNAITSGMVLSSLLTAALVALLLAIYFRSATLLVLLVGTVSIATAAAFGAAAVTVGHLNAATAFLGAIIAGNGINYGIFLIARYLEERRGHDVDESLAQAIQGTLRPTAVASLGASIAYGSLAATSFKGFADFAVIGAIGMMLCWLASYTLLPALMVKFGRNTRIYHGNPLLGSMLARLIGFRRSHMVVLVAAVLFAGAGVIVYRYIAADPFEYTISNLRSKGDDAVEARDWMQLSDKRFGRGISGRTYIAADRLDQVPMILEALKKIPAIGAVDSLPAYVPADQDKRLAVLNDIRALLDQALDDLDDNAKKELAELRPPDDLKPFTVKDLPASLRDKFTEKDGQRVGYLIAVRPSEQLDEWKGQDLLTFANAVRELHLPDGETVTTSGASVIFADIIESIERDGPVVTSVALGGLIIMVVLLVGRNRRAIAVMLATIGGAILMIAVCALLDIKVNFLDFVALPITLGLGIDYAINVAHRHDEEDIPDPITTLRTSGSAVLICSMTTMIGYGSLLVSENLAIRGFGTASLIGEVTTVLTALVLVPALLANRSSTAAAHSSRLGEVRAFAGLVAFVAACGFEHGTPAGNGPDDGGPDGPLVDAMLDAEDPPNPDCFGTSPFVVCLAALPTQPLDISVNIDTDGPSLTTCNNGTGVVMTVAGTSSCVLAGTDITFSGPSTTGSSGSRPVVLVATGTITITATQTLDARSASTGTGPGADPMDCGTASNGAAGGGAGGGGGGGSFGGKGGDGASGGGGTAAGGAAKPAVTAPVTKLRGGCPGGTGAGGTAASAGGAGGGAVLMIAKSKIQIDGTLTVAGAGGLGGQSSKGGGGGGGSGGMIVLHAPTLSIGAAARLFANGGGGGGGAGAGADGVAGEDSILLGSAASGGTTAGGGTSAGGAGGFKAQAAATPPNGGGGSGGGGGGGAVGVVRVLSGQTISGNNVSPAPN